MHPLSLGATAGTASEQARDDPGLTFSTGFSGIAGMPPAADHQIAGGNTVITPLAEGLTAAPGDQMISPELTVEPVELEPEEAPDA